MSAVNNKKLDSNGSGVHTQTESVLELVESFQTTKSNNRLKNGLIYEGSYKDGSKSGRGKIRDDICNEFVEGEWMNDRLVRLYFAQFQINSRDYVRLNALDNLYSSNKNNFVARIMLSSINISSEDFPEIRREIESKIKVLKILDDDLKRNLELSREKLEMLLKIRQNHITHSKEAQQDIFELFLMMETCFEHDDTSLLNKILLNKSISQNLRDTTRNVCLNEQNFFDRNKDYPFMHEVEMKFNWNQVISSCVKNGIRNLKTAFIDALPTKSYIVSGQEDLNKINDYQLLTCSVQDIQLFSDLELASQQYMKDEFDTNKFKSFIKDYVNKLWAMLITEIAKSEFNDISDEGKFTKRVYLQLFKTFFELMQIVCDECKEEISKIVSIEPNADLCVIKGKTKGLTEIRLEFLINLMNYFKPGKLKNDQFKYSFSFFKVNDNIVVKLTGFIANYFDNSALSSIPQELAIWIYYIHKSFNAMLNLEECQQKLNKQNLFVFLNSLMNLCIIAAKSQEISLETIRILANSIIKFGVTISPYFLDQVSLNENEIDILLKQAEYMKNYVTCYEQSTDITDIVDTYQVFWDERKNLFTVLQNKYSTWPSAVDEIIEKFNSFTKYVFELNIYSNKFLIFLRSYNEFIRLLRGTNFSWYIKANDLISKRFVEIIDKDTNSYLVRDSKTEEFIKEFSDESKNLPCNYLFHLSKDLLNCVEDFLRRSCWEEYDKFQAAGELLLLMGRSLIGFNRLPGAVDFEHFFSLFTEPFKRVTQNASDLSDFKKRLASLENYYKYTMELNVMSVVKAIELCKEKMNSNSSIDYTFNTENLELAYEMYDTKFKNYIDKYILKEDFDVEKFAQKIRAKIKSVDVSKWDRKYKILEVPKLLAGLCAVWSALESEDVLCQNQLIKPHCIQILCVLRLLGADQTDVGLVSHLAQVLTGQGKSLVLALLAAALALTGNRARIVCYNINLAQRDQNNFAAFYEIFDIEDCIIYGTFHDMANEILNLDINGKNYDLGSLVKQLVTNELSNLCVKEKENSISTTVLLIDEVDVFFSPEFYGNTYNAGEQIHSETFANLQLKIWNLTAYNNNVTEITEKAQQFIDEQFYENTDDVFMQIARNSRNILNKEVDQMISNAISVRKSHDGDWYSRKFKLREDGRIITIKDDGEYSDREWYTYSNVFMYFKLKRNNFNNAHFKNYGYLSANCGKISYALLPKNYSSILGVTGTLKQMSNVEMSAVKSYGIMRGSDMPTFFGTNKLIITNFIIKETEDLWTTAILNSILTITNEERAVIVFFKDVHKIENIRDKFTKHLSRFSVLTGNENSEEMDRCVEEAGIARKITIATRFMGRGTDFKSNDSVVESKGGIHVIQTFFSEDVKEETQIKGRTARKDNKGSYEIILCREHLNEDDYDSSKCTYEDLDSVRKIRDENRGSELSREIKQSNELHNKSMKFLKSFYSYSRDKRDEYLNSYCSLNYEN